MQLAATAGDQQAEITFSAGDNAGATVLAYEYQLDDGPLDLHRRYRGALHTRGP